ncbi:MAG: PTS sugar transporter subunit IIA [Candidatus Eisenbacteria bacterium]
MTESPHFLKYFDPRLFSTELRAKTKEGALKEMIELVAKGDGVRDKALLLEMLTRREQLGSTGIGSGVAIPHGRSLAVVDTKVVFARSTKGIPFDAIDEQPVHLFFLIVAPPQDKKNEYLPLLGKIAELVQDAEVRDALQKVEDWSGLRQVVMEALGE